MFNVEHEIYEQFRTLQIYDQCCGEGLQREYDVPASDVTFAHMKASGQVVLAALLKGSGWALTFSEKIPAAPCTRRENLIVLLWVGAPGAQRVLPADNGQ